MDWEEKQLILMRSVNIGWLTKWWAFDHISVRHKQCVRHNKKSPSDGFDTKKEKKNQKEKSALNKQPELSDIELLCWFLAERSGATKSKFSLSKLRIKAPKFWTVDDRFWRWNTPTCHVPPLVVGRRELLRARETTAPNTPTTPDNRCKHVGSV